MPVVQRLAGDVHEPVARRLIAEGLSPVLDVGSGTGRLVAGLTNAITWIGVDESPTQLAEAPSPAIRADACHLPLTSNAVGAVAALWMLYHLDRPVEAIEEARRVLRPGGLFVASATRRDDSPEIAPPRKPTTFDAEDAPSVVEAVFGAVEVEAWDEPMFVLETRKDVRDYLVSRCQDPRRADAVDVPVRVTKRGALVWGRKRG
jgi:SAM-dependent methyltransferase